MPRLGLISDPDSPDHVARALAQQLPEQLEEHIGGSEWVVEVVCDPVVAGRSKGKEILDAVENQRTAQRWDYAIGVTDLPLRTSSRPVLANIGGEHPRVGLVSLPALGGLQPRRRARQMMLQAVDEILRATEESRGTESAEEQPRKRRRGLHSALTELLAPIRREEPEGTAISVRYRATKWRGRARLLSGMVRSNTPWRLVLGMSGAVAASLASSVFGLTSSTVWQIGDMLGPVRRGVVVAGVIALMTAWLILTHRLWEKPQHSHDREQRVLYNASTATTVTIGVGVLYIALFLVNLALASLLIDPQLLGSKLGGTTSFGDYLGLAWGAASMGVAAGALGSGLEDDATVRRAAYGYREAQRRESQQRAEQQEEQHGRNGG
ncbi:MULTISPECIES: hypothetical protein [unclassified Actinopolyspora]|uniref:hypothetical protein n=1 Tax=unclassified Actinopolyspora TaxID=2639451 RepID=UPI0013F695CD|nr:MULTISPECIES: hypothetical protein [unclassified Actinopolyspora]NHD18148.1 hypothetical protein [Actinopolyspora sp. BKK2]NHE77175.1 hypothetical protein [Actinopolyspora sp. BKK1]